MARAPLDTPEQLFHFGGEPAAADVGSQPGTEQRTSHPQGGAKPGEKILITGIAGGQGRLIARRLAGTFALTGVDREPWEGHPPGLNVHVLDLRKRKTEDIFRTERPDAVVHHAFIRHFRADPRTRHEVNVLGTKLLLEYCATYGVKRVVVSRTYPEVRDLVEADTLCSTFLWRHPEIATTILRPVNTLGYYASTAIGRYLRQGYVPTILGFNPMMQFIHEEDVAEAVALALQAGTHGIYNVVGPGAVPLKLAVQETGGTAVPFPEFVARGVFGRLFQLGLYHTPPGAIDFLKYSLTLDGRRFTHATDFKPLFSLEDIFASVRR
jgi:UDP-glucose 4-epimerase